MIEERAGREIARRRGLLISGVAGQILRAYREDHCRAEEARRMLEELHRGHRIHRQLLTALVEEIDLE